MTRSSRLAGLTAAGGGYSLKIPAPSRFSISHRIRPRGYSRNQDGPGITAENQEGERDSGNSVSTSGDELQSESAKQGECGESNDEAREVARAIRPPSSRSKARDNCDASEFRSTFRTVGPNKSPDSDEYPPGDAYEETAPSGSSLPPRQSARPSANFHMRLGMKSETQSSKSRCHPPPRPLEIQPLPDSRAEPKNEAESQSQSRKTEQESKPYGRAIHFIGSQL
jgi:hypothetical protein